MTHDEIVETLIAKAALNQPLGYVVTFDMGEHGVVSWDGRSLPAVIDGERRDADTTLKLSLDAMVDLLAGNLDPTLAFMTGKLKVEGSMGVAMKLNTMLSD